MIDYGKWIYSKDIAGWFSQRAFGIDAQMNVICLASHRTLTEKLEGLKELYAESGEKSVSDRINIINSLQNRSCQDTSKLIQSDKRFLEIILHDRKPNSMRRKEYEKNRLAYIRGLTERGRKQWGQ